MNPLYSALKRTLDIVVSFVVLTVLSPVLLWIALVVRFTSPGPVFFRQFRLGKEGKPFGCYKFRTMYVDVPDVRNPDGSTYNADNDPRVTRVGCFLRANSLDELPQLINVLGGEMSLVGPRPDQLDQIQYYTEEEKLRLLVKPGITGLAQISGRNSIPWEQRKKLDVEYVAQQSLWLDLKILAATIPYVFLRRGIYVNTDDGLPGHSLHH